MDKCNNSYSFSNEIGVIDFWDSISDEIKTAMWEYIHVLFHYIIIYLLIINYLYYLSLLK